MLDNQTYFDPHAMKDNINFPEVPQPTYVNIMTGKDGHYEMQNSTEVGYEYEMENGSQSRHVYEMGPTEAHEIHYVSNIHSSLTTGIQDVWSGVLYILPLQAEPHSPDGVQEYYSSIIHKVLILCSMYDVEL